jgi:hypothetical protein
MLVLRCISLGTLPAIEICFFMWSFRKRAVRESIMLELTVRVSR